VSKVLYHLILAALLLSAAGIFSRCGKDNTKVLPDTVSFSRDVIPVFNDHCNISGCHSGGSPAANLNLEPDVAYADLFAKHEIDTITPTNSVLYIQMNSSSTIMPPTGRLDDYTVNLVLKWIEQGAKNN